MDTTGYDSANASLVLRLELQDIVSELPLRPQPTEIDDARERVNLLFSQLKELAAFDTHHEADESGLRAQQSVYRAMLSDFPEVDRLLLEDTEPTRNAHDGSDQPADYTPLRESGKDGYYDDSRIDPNGGTDLENYKDALEIDEKYPPQECYWCLEQHPASQIIENGKCDHEWCRHCLLRRFELALKNESNYPVRSCGDLPVYTL